jgi:transposase
VIETEMAYEGIKQRWMLYQSAPADKRERRTIEKRLLNISIKETKRLQKLTRTPFFCEADAQEALKSARGELSSIDIIGSTLKAIPKFNTKGRPKSDATPDRYEYRWDLTIASNIDTLKEQIDKKSGFFILATNDLSLTPKALLDAYKSQQRVERGFRFLKSPEFLVDSLYLKNPERIEAMLMVMTLCLMVYAALEYRIRKELKEKNETFPNQLGKPVQNPTARWIFENFFAIHILLLDG